MDATPRPLLKGNRMGNGKRRKRAGKTVSCDVKKCQKPFSLKGVDLNNRLDVINLRSVNMSFYSKT